MMKYVHSILQHYDIKLKHSTFSTVHKNLLWTEMSLRVYNQIMLDLL